MKFMDYMRCDATSDRGARRGGSWLRRVTAIAGLLLSPLALAQPTAFSYQGKLTDAGVPATGNYDLQFRLYDTGAVGTGLQQGTAILLPAVAVDSGIFTVALDFGANVFDGSGRYLEIGVRPGNSMGTFTLLAPRHPINSSPYAVQTINAQQLGGLPASRYVSAAANGNVGIGTGNPLSGRLHVVGNGNAAVYGDGGTATGVQGVSTSSVGVRGVSSSFEGVRGETASTTSGGVVGYNSSGAGYGVFGSSEGEAVRGQSTAGTGVMGTSTTGAGVRGNSSSYVGVWGTSTLFEGVRGESGGASSGGVVGYNTGGTGPGVYGSGAGTGAGVSGVSVTGSGVVGQSSATNTVGAAGVYGKGLGSAGIGVIGEANVANAVGVFGVSSSPDGFGVYARALNGGARALYVDGPATQTASFGGIIKAAVEVVPSVGGVYINKCFNGVTATTSPNSNCGIVVTQIQNGFVRVTFPFDVSNRFFSLSAEWNPGLFGHSGGFYKVGANYRKPVPGLPGEIDIFTFVDDNSNDTIKATFTLLVF